MPKLLERATEFAQKWLNFVKKEDLQQSSMSHSGLKIPWPPQAIRVFGPTLFKMGSDTKLSLRCCFTTWKRVKSSKPRQP